ncbi:MAG: hypothetical protein ACYC00_21960 [Eubacteriales bacterium]
MKNWGKGIPKYQSSDLMTESELQNFAMQIVKEYEIDKNHYEILATTDELNKVPNFVIKISNTICFVVVKADIAPNMPILTNDEKVNILNHAKQFNAKCYFASVGIGSCDADRFNASIALRGDGFYSNYRGLEEIV